MNDRENRKNNQEWTIQGQWQLWAHKTHGEDIQNKTQFRELIGQALKF